jgi:hypothetical protein
MMKKKGGGRRRKNWKTRMFVLKGTYFFYYKSEDVREPLLILNIPN